MTIQECYDLMGGDYGEVAGRFVTEARVEKFAKMFLRDTSFEMLKQTMGQKDYKEAFHLAPYLHEEDLGFLHGEIRKMTPFPESQDFLHISKMPKHNITIGAALPYIQAFLNP